jgi:hypothetical protein
LLIGRLKHWRRRVAAASGLPAFRVLTNATLERIAEYKPTSTDQLEQISGVGPATIEEYGFDLIELVVHNVSSASDPLGSASQETETTESAIPKTPTTQSAAATEPRETSEDLVAAASNHAEITANSQSASTPSTEPDVKATQTTPRKSGDSAGQNRPSDAPAAYWTWRLVGDGYQIDQIAKIRRMEPRQVIADLIDQAGEGRKITAEWINDQLTAFDDAKVGADSSLRQLAAELSRLVTVDGRG